MRIFGSYLLPFERGTAYRHLHDPVILAGCVPGCEQFVQVGENEYAVSMKLVMPPLSGLFSGTIKITEAIVPESFKMVVEGSGAIGSLKGEGLINLAKSGDATELAYDGDIQVGGSIVAAGQRVIDATAKMMIGKFFEKFIEVAGVS